MSVDVKINDLHKILILLWELRGREKRRKRGENEGRRKPGQKERRKRRKEEREEGGWQGERANRISYRVMLTEFPQDGRTDVLLG